MKHVLVFNNHWLAHAFKENDDLQAPPWTQILWVLLKYFLNVQVIYDFVFSIECDINTRDPEM